MATGKDLDIIGNMHGIMRFERETDHGLRERITRTIANQAKPEDRDLGEEYNEWRESLVYPDKAEFIKALKEL
jgi:hypothetical protein